MMIGPRFDNSYTRLPARFYARLEVKPVAAPTLICINDKLAEELGIDVDFLRSPAGLNMLSGCAMPPGAEPLAQVYAGHQFGRFVPQLGDGRAMLLGEVVDRRGARRDLQLKGSGRTPFSRGGDGRAALGPVLREYLVAEAMTALGIPTTRALAIVTTGENVLRESVLPGAILTRVATSHIRVGTFQYFADRGDTEAVQLLADHVIDRHYPDIRHEPGPYRALIGAVAECQATLIARWLAVGFIHGVMNTDNISVGGETLDYGPCAFLDTFDPTAVFNSIDRSGRYAYCNQPSIGLWNMARFAETLLPLLAARERDQEVIAREEICRYSSRFDAEFRAAFHAKLGLGEALDGDANLVQSLLSLMADSQADFSLVFSGLAGSVFGPDADEPVRTLFNDPLAFDGWAAIWRRRLSAEARPLNVIQESMRQVNPAFIPRNHHVEAAIKAAVEQNDYGLFDTLCRALSMPYEDRPTFTAYGNAPAAHERICATFCGT
ncbi:YdiU family protein [Ancylobacter sp. IITR112]|uniref:protein adenylyltransferase SelO n=1 Tax=Ancylobacter sp. IITR112 TaxID=3138073 RepID=UPI00352A2962